MSERRIDEAAAWRAAYARLDPLLDLEPAARNDAIEAMDLDTATEEKLRALLAGQEQTGPLDAALDAGPDAWLPIVEAAAAADDAGSTGRRIGDWHLGPELGQGGMGVVYRATRQAEGFVQSAALKLLRIGMSGPSGHARFRREQRILARLDHPNIARMIDGGVTEDGSPYLVLQEVDGVPIDDDCAARHANAGMIVERVLDVCRAVAYAHSNLVVHRDLKPANILVGADGHVTLLDFGIAKLLDDEGSGPVATRVLTPGYGAPEQHSGDAVTTATDVYGIGAVLYSLLAGRSLADGFEPAPKPSLSPDAAVGIDDDLDNVVRMALRPEPTRRYPSAEALSEDLERWRTDQPLEATPDSLGYRLRKGIARHRAAVLAGIVASLALVGGSGIAVWQASEARAQARRAEASAADAALQVARAEAVTDILVSTFTAADPRADASDQITAREILDAGAARIDTDVDTAPEVRQRLRSVLGEVSLSVGDLSRAESLFARNLEASAAAMSDAVARDARVRDLRLAAKTASIAGQQALADARFEEASTLATTCSESTRVAVALDQAEHLHNTERQDDAIGRLESLFDSGWLASIDEDTWVSAHATYASTLNSVGRFEDARRYGEMALNRLVPGDNRYANDRARIDAILASIEGNLGNITRAAELTERALDIRMHMLGARHPNVLVMRNDLATYWKNLGRFDASASMLESVLEDQVAVLGDAHPFVAYTHFNLAEALVRAAIAVQEGSATDRSLSLTAALDHYREAVTRAMQTPASFGEAAAVFRASYGRALAWVGRTAEGEAEMRAALARYGPDATSPMAPRLRVIYAGHLNDEGQHAAAVRLTEAAVPALAEIYGEGSRAHALALLEHGRALAPTDPATARAHLDAGIASLRASPFHRQYAREIGRAETLLSDLVAR